MKKLLVVILVALGTLGFGIGVRPAMAAKPYIEMGSINNTTVITNRLVIFEMRGGNYKKMDISRGCSGIRNGFFFKSKRGRIYKSDTLHGGRGGQCYIKTIADLDGESYLKLRGG